MSDEHPTIMPELVTITNQPSPKIIHTPIPTKFSTPTKIPVDVLLMNLQESLLTQIRTSATIPPEAGDSMQGISNVNYLEFESPENEDSFWIFYSEGIREYDPLQNHFVKIFKLDEGTLESVSGVELENIDYLYENSIELVKISPQLTLIMVKGGVGAHSGCVELLHFNNNNLTNILSDCSSSPRTSEAVDLNGDRTLEVLINKDENYVFCYACNLRIKDYDIWRWNGNQLEKVGLNYLPLESDTELVQLNNKAVDLAEAELWVEAKQVIDSALDQYGTDETLKWNAHLINFIEDSRRKEIQNSSFPLLSYLFVGDYEEVIDMMREYRPDELFSVNPPLIEGTAAQGWENSIYDWVVYFTDKALKLKPDFAPAYFLRAWATFLVDPTSLSITSDISNASDFDPDESLYSDSLRFLRTSKEDDS